MIKVCLLVVAVAFVGALGASTRSEWAQFVEFEAKFEKVYGSSAERDSRFEVFKQNLKHIQEHNARRGVSYKKGINQFADLTGKKL